MKIFDCHCHIEQGWDRYNLAVSGRNVIFNSVESYRLNHKLLGSSDRCSLIFDFKSELDFVLAELRSDRISALKIHSRIQQLTVNDYPVLLDCLQKVKPVTPIIIDAFYFGANLKVQPSLEFVSDLARTFPAVPIIVAHSGGHKVLSYFYHLRELENVYFDLSFSLAYLQHTSVYLDFKNLIRFGDHSRLLFGSDFPFIDAADQYAVLRRIFSELSISTSSQEKILSLNSEGLFCSDCEKS